MGFQNVNENAFHGVGSLVMWLWKSFGSSLKVVCTNSVMVTIRSPNKEIVEISFLLLLHVMSLG